MQGINGSKHKHLVDALLGLETLLNSRLECVQEAEEYRRELEDIHFNYERLLEDLAEQIRAYEEIADLIRVRFLAVKLRELKKGIAVKEPAYIVLLENIHLAYGT